MSNEKEDLYDEFGNYIGPDLDDDSDGDDSEDDEEEEEEEVEDNEYTIQYDNDDKVDNAMTLKILSTTASMNNNNNNGGGGILSSNSNMMTMGLPSNAIVLHEDKVHYPSASTVYGPDVITAVLDEDAMDIDTPLVLPASLHKNATRGGNFFSLAQPFDPLKDATVLSSSHDGDDETAAAISNHKDSLLYSTHLQFVSEEYLSTAILNNTATTTNRRGVAIVGHLHTGKTSFIDLLYEHTLRIIHPFGLLRSSQEVYSSIRASVPSGKGKKSSTNSLSNDTAGGGGATDLGYNAAPLHGGVRITDTLRAEQDRQLSLQSTPITIPLANTKGKTYALTLIDCPGHNQFHDESVAALRSVDGVILTLDVVEGIQLHTEMLIGQIITEGLPLVLLLTKVDRLIVELKLSPMDAYAKIQYGIDSINQLIQEKSMGRYPLTLCPTKGNVAFSSALHGWFFTLHSFARLYVDHVSFEESKKEDNEWEEGEEENEEDKDNLYRPKKKMGMESLGQYLSVDDFAQRLWGDCYLDSSTHTFKKSSRDCQNPHSTPKTFIQFVLEPMYKIYSVCLGESEATVNKTLRKLGILLSKDQLRMSPRPLLRAAFQKFFGHFGPGVAGFVDMMIQHIPTPKDAAHGKVHRCYSGPMNTSITKAMTECNPDGPLMMHIVKLYPTHDGQSFSAFGRIYSGTVKPGDQVKVLGEGYSPDDDSEDMTMATISAVSIPRGRRRTAVSMAVAGNWVLLDGIDSTIAKTATITSCKQTSEDSVYIFHPLRFPQAGGESVMKLSIEPLNPADLPKMVEGLRRVSKAYPMVKTRVEESGEHVVFGTGELYLDCVMHDLRHVFSDVEIKVADPSVGFRETISDTSSIKCYAETANRWNKITVIAEPLEDGLAETLEAGKVNMLWDVKKMGRFFQTKYDWDLLSARSVWAFGPMPKTGPNILMDDTLPSEVDKVLLNSCKSSIVQGFQWATREGPLCEEPVRSTKIKILDVVLADKPILRGGGQMIPTTRKVVHSSILTASPRLMEPVYRVQMQCPGDILEGIQPIISKRRGHIVYDKPIPGTPFTIVKAFLPVIDSFGFETDVRTLTQGQAMVFSVFDHWAVVPGDPMDRSIILHPLEPSPMQHLAREFMVKTRRRKGLSDDVSVLKFFDEGMRSQFE